MKIVAEGVNPDVQKDGAKFLELVASWLTHSPLAGSTESRIEWSENEQFWKGEPDQA